MGGFVYVNTGLLKLADNEAELASVIGHEIGHIAKSSYGQANARDAAVCGGVGLDRNTAGSDVDLALRRPHSRQAGRSRSKGIKDFGTRWLCPICDDFVYGKLLGSAQFLHFEYPPGETSDVSPSNVPLILKVQTVRGWIVLPIRSSR